ncbi:hypothetical protein [Flammeovirga sp. SJP92]|uniref:hypothetical protein n=1 Tax=Flammeovirga sp. SJP92 TaxID=1775430 RepID=UPI0007889783|nr:hypothetical protein [Flammeovirga sp. SJP92]KXX71517.1 hypothetical protein AVL50_04400 [Flammeovirga sp. SJP92]
MKRTDWCDQNFFFVLIREQMQFPLSRQKIVDDPPIIEKFRHKKIPKSGVLKEEVREKRREKGR